MESSDRELIQTLLGTDQRLRRLYEEHLELEEVLLQYANRVFLTADEQMEAKRLKKRKLNGVDRMMNIISSHRMQTGACAPM